MNEPMKYNPIATVAMLLVGLLILVPSGLCTGWFGIGALVAAFANPAHANDTAPLFFMALVVGGPFVIGGGALVWLAIRRIRRS
jgi:hypothetical protein